MGVELEGYRIIILQILKQGKIGRGKRCIAINTGVWLGELSGNSAVSFGASPKQDFAGLPTLVALWDEPPVLCLTVIWLAHVQTNR
jgi:hypothetical protein